MNSGAVNNLKEVIEKNKLQKKIMIWGCTDKSDEIVSLFIKWNFSIIGYIDKEAKNICQYKGYKVFEIDELEKERYFVYVALNSNYDEVIEKLYLYGYKEFLNYWYPRRLVKLDGTKNYYDLYGNSLTTDNVKPINIFLKDGGKMTIKSKSLNSTLKITSEGNSKVSIGDSVVFGNEVEISSTNGEIDIENSCKFENNIKLRVSSGGKISLGKHCTVQRACIFVASFNAKLCLKDDCMVSYYVLLRAGNSHNIVDLDSMKNLDDNTLRDVNIGEHVWIGMRATVMNGVVIGSGSTIGANSFVCKKQFPNNCCLAGNPAKIIRNRTAWLRDGVSMCEDMEQYLEYIYD